MARYDIKDTSIPEGNLGTLGANKQKQTTYIGNVYEGVPRSFRTESIRK